ncbi:nitroreductase family deazaflavin-dependent oxidoreductase [Dactylosporangium sp. NPDC005572]|uniref:nitroreductase family deazaflavin-dependent oxidoreductase n=1 Tax=Dactylosporangium sp. NPDC005572 TaxID=3156889 RepID=UPI0033ABADEF
MPSATQPVPRLANHAFSALVRLGLGKDYRHILTVTGRTTGRPRSTPVDVMTDGRHRWLVAPYGVTNWVRNARAAGQVALQRGRRRETLRVTELPTAERVPVLRQYLREVPITARYFDVTDDSSDAAWLAEAQRHPVFRLESN